MAAWILPGSRQYSLENSFQRQVSLELTKVPNLTSILSNCTVAGEHSDTCDIEYSFAYPDLRMLVLSRNISLGADIRTEIGHQEIVIAIQQDVANPSEQARLAGT